MQNICKKCSSCKSCHQSAKHAAAQKTFWSWCGAPGGVVTCWVVNFNLSWRWRSRKCEFIFCFYLRLSFVMMTHHQWYCVNWWSAGVNNQLGPQNSQPSRSRSEVKSPSQSRAAISIGFWKLFLKTQPTEAQPSGGLVSGFPLHGDDCRMGDSGAVRHAHTQGCVCTCIFLVCKAVSRMQAHVLCLYFVGEFFERVRNYESFSCIPERGRPILESYQ